MKQLKKHLAMYICMFMAVFCALTLKAEAGNVRTGTLGDHGGISWTYDEDTKTLTITGEDSGLVGVYDEESSTYKSPFVSICGDVKKIIVEDCTLIGSAKGLFAGLESVESIEFNEENFNTGHVTDMSYMFHGCSSLLSLDMRAFYTPNVTDMSYMFCKCKKMTELQLSGLDTSEVTDMTSMFEQCFKLETLLFANFKTSNVTSMRKMFYKCNSIEVLNLAYFDTSQVSDLYHTFAECTALKTLRMSSFDLSKVTNVKNTFNNCSSLATIHTPKVMPETLSVDLPATYVDSKKNITTKLTKEFCNTTLTLNCLVSEVSLSDSSLTLTVGERYQLKATVLPSNATDKTLTWKSSDETVVTVDSTGYIKAVGSGKATITATAKDASGVSASCEVTVVCPTSGYLGDNDGIYWSYNTDTKTLTITGEDSGLKASSLTNNSSPFATLCGDVEVIVLQDCTLKGSVHGAFKNLKSLEKVECKNVDTTEVTYMTCLFEGCESLTSVDLSSFNTTNVIGMQRMFAGCISLTDLDLSGFDNTKVTGMTNMFYGCESLTDLDLSNFNTENVTDMTAMFCGCTSLKSLDLSDFNTKNLTWMTAMFNGCESLTDLDLSSFDTTNVTSMGYIFSGCKSLTSLDLSSFDLSKVTDFGMEFANCTNLAVINTPKAMPDEKKMYLEGTYAVSATKRTEYINKDFCNTTLVNVNNLVTGISLATPSVELKPGDAKQLQATVAPEKALIKEMTWKSSDTSVATVDANGKVTAVAEGTATITVTATDLLGTNVSATCEVTVIDPMSVQERQIRAFVSRMYTVALNREAEAEGLDFYTERLLSGDSNGACLAQSFLCSPEFLNKGYDNAQYVKVLYKTFFDREPAAEEVNYWVGQINSGKSRAFVLAGFVNSVEFDNLCASYGISRGFMREDGKPLNPGIGRFAERLYTVVLERAGEKEGIEYWSLGIANGVCTPKDAAKNFFLSPEYINKNTSDAQYITTLYKAFMDREPEAGGVEYWQNLLQNGATREQILEGFADSAEFQGIMASFGL